MSAQQSTTRQIRERGIYQLNLGNGSRVFVVATESISDGVLSNLHTLAAWGNADQVSYYVLNDGQIVGDPEAGTPRETGSDDGSLFDTNRTAEYADPTASVDQRVMDRLGITDDALNSLYVTGTVNGFVGTVVADDIRRDWQCDPQLPLGMALAERGVLTDEEAEYLDDDA